MLFLNRNGTVKFNRKISNSHGFFKGEFDYIGTSVAMIGDLDGNGSNDFITGGMSNTDTGSLWVLFMNSSFTVLH